MNNIYNTFPRFCIENYKRFKKRTVITIKPFTIFVGPNGGGKSTILDAISIFNNTIWGWFMNQEDSKSFVRNQDFTSLISSGSDPYGKFTLSLEIPSSTGWKFIEFEYVEMEHNTEINKISYGIINSEEIKTSTICIYPNRKIKIDIKKVNFILEPILRHLGLEFDIGWQYFTKFHNQDPERIEVTLGDDENLTNLVINNLIERGISKELLIYCFSIYYTQLFEIYGNMIFQVNYPEIFMAVEMGVNSLLELSKSDIEKTKKFAEKENDIRLDWIQSELIPYFASFKKMEDVRKEPPEYFEVVSEKVQNDYYGLCQFLVKQDKKDKLENPNGYGEKKFNKLIYLLKEFEIADNIELEKVGERKPNFIFYQITLYKNKRTFPLKNLSSGGKQILPVIMMLVGGENNLTIRQPELHLHPKIQMKIPDLLNEIKKERTLLL